MAKRNQIIIGGIWVAAALIALVTALYLLLWAPPTQADYRAAREASTKADKSYNELNKAFEAYLTAASGAYQDGAKPSEAEKQYREEKTEFEALHARHIQQMKDLSGMKAMRNDEVRASFEKYESQDAKYMNFVMPFTNAYVAMTRANNYSCKDVFSSAKLADNGEGPAIAAKNKELSKDCFSDLEKSRDAGDASYRDYAKASIVYFQKRQKNLDELAARSDEPYKEVLADYSRQTKADTEVLSRAATDFILDRNDRIEVLADSSASESFQKLIKKKTEAEA